MAVYTKLTLDDAARILAELGLPRPQRIDGIAAGSRHTNYRVTTEKEILFLRVNERTTPDDIAYERELIEHLVAAGFATPPFASPRVAEFQGKPVTAFTFLSGEPVPPHDLALEQIAAIGTQLGNFHVVTRDFKPRRENPFSPDRVLAICDQILRGGTGTVSRDARRLREEVERSQSSFEGLAPSTIHGDLFHDNILWDGDRITAILDFEMASTGALPYDVAVAILALTFDGNDFRWHHARAFVRSYSAVNMLETIERNALYWIARFAAARFAISRIVDFELGPKTDARDRVLKDYRDFVRRLERLEAVGGAEFLERVLG